MSKSQLYFKVDIYPQMIKIILKINPKFRVSDSN